MSYPEVCGPARGLTLFGDHRDVATRSHRWQSGYDIRTAQELLWHADVATTMIYTRVLKVGDGGVPSARFYVAPGYLPLLQGGASRAAPPVASARRLTTSTSIRDFPSRLSLGRPVSSPRETERRR